MGRRVRSAEPSDARGYLDGASVVDERDAEGKPVMGNWRVVEAGSEGDGWNRAV